MTPPLFLVGAGVADIDLPTGQPMAGYARRNGLSQGTGRPLQARAAAFQDPDGHRGLVVVLDILYVTAAMTAQIEHVLADRTGVPATDIIVSATHTHSGPQTGDPASALGQVITKAAVDAGTKAIGRLSPAALWSTRVPVTGLGLNRRHGASGPLEAHVLVACNPADPTRVITVLVEFSCHPTVLEHDNLLYCPDYPGFARELLGQLVDAPVVFLQGCAGDINPVFHAHTLAAARQAGAILATAVGHRLSRGLRDLADPRYVNLTWNGSFRLPGREPLTAVPVGPIRVREATVQARPADVPNHDAAAAALAAAKAAWKAVESRVDYDDVPSADIQRRGAVLGRAWAEELRSAPGAVLPPGRRSMLDPLGPTVDITVRALHLGGECVIVGLPGENFSAIGRDLVSHPGAPPTVLLQGYARQSIGYLPPLEEYGQDGYEVGGAILAPGAAEAVAAAGTCLIATPLGDL
jgi:hypothetical protein